MEEENVILALVWKEDEHVIKHVEIVASDIFILTTIYCPPILFI